MLLYSLVLDAAEGLSPHHRLFTPKRGRHTSQFCSTACLGWTATCRIGLADCMPRIVRSKRSHARPVPANHSPAGARALAIPEIRETVVASLADENGDFSLEDVKCIRLVQQHWKDAMESQIVREVVSRSNNV